MSDAQTIKVTVALTRDEVAFLAKHRSSTPPWTASPGPPTTILSKLAHEVMSTLYTSGVVSD